jgi:hypothetical protein
VSRAFDGPAVARAYILDHGADVKKLNRKPIPTLRDLHCAELAKQGTAIVMGGPGSRDELVNAIADLRWPHTAEARRVYYSSVSDGNVTATGHRPS